MMTPHVPSCLRARYAKVAMLVLAPVMVGGTALPAHAKSASENLAVCRQVADAGQRLACYDRLADADTQETKVRQEKQFGLNESQKAPEDRKEAETITSKIAAIGRSSITLENGMVWKLMDETRLLDWMRIGQEATVSRGFFSGYRLTVNGVNGRAVVSRLQ